MKKIFTLILLGMIAFNVIHAEITWNLSNGILTISGTGDMEDYDNTTNIPWFSRRNGVKQVVIENGVTSIANNSFCECINLTSITIPNSVTNIGHSAFRDCYRLTSVYIPHSITNIGNDTFLNCIDLTSINVEVGNEKYDSRNNSNAIIETKSNTLILGCKNTVIPNSVTSIGDNAFYGSCVTTINIPNSVTSIGRDSFRGSNLISISIPSSVTYIGEYAFADCHNLTAITISESMTSIENSTFFNCAHLKSVTIPNSITNIGNYSFAYCPRLASVIIPSSVTNIGNQAFSGCIRLASITCEASNPPNCGNDCFREIDISTTVYVLGNSIDAYKVANEWKNFYNIKTILYVITDGESYTNNLQLEERDICYTRTFNNTNWQALYIPFSLSYEDWKEDFDVAYINGIRQIDTNDDNVIDETIMDVYRIEDGSLFPNTPYLIRAKTIGDKTISVSNATLYEAVENSIDCSTTIAKYTFTGTYEIIPASTLIENEYYAMGGGSVVMTDGESDLKPFRWYLKIEARSPIYNVANTSNAAKTISINVLDEKGEATGISQLSQNDKTISCIYDLNGRAVNENTLKPGMYIKNGKKFVIK